MPFNYSEIEDIDTRQAWEQAAKDIHRLEAQGSESVREIGRRLVHIKDGKRVDHGQFQRWVREEFGYPPRTAQYYMRVGRFMEALGPNAQRFAHLPAHVLYDLAGKDQSELLSQLLTSNESLLPADIRHRIAANKKRRMYDGPTEDPEIAEAVAVIIASEQETLEALHGANVLDRIIRILRSKDKCLMFSQDVADAVEDMLYEPIHQEVRF